MPDIAESMAGEYHRIWVPEKKVGATVVAIFRYEDQAARWANANYPGRYEADKVEGRKLAVE